MELEKQWLRLRHASIESESSLIGSSDVEKFVWTLCFDDHSLDKSGYKLSQIFKYERLDHKICRFLQNQYIGGKEDAFVTKIDRTKI
ncbi:hypothetical protein BpHYR1_016242 [Brachionus plicatilis]|uniref:Uncharacterized protein n=1 Tax=Brachionus plicatilis TaxID=10195 RepID=A0A3M7RIB4_BRAPC|nr:hypothetical protein BpHYR1_016242 [Brachionus plicatilis]